MSASQLRGLPVGDAAFLELFGVEDVEGAIGGEGDVFVDHEGAGFFPELVIGGFHGLDDFGVLCGDVFFLGGVFVHVVEVVTYEAVALVADGEFIPLLGVGFRAGFPAGGLGEKVAVFPWNFWVFEERDEVAAFNLVGGEIFDSGDGGEGGEHVNVGGDFFDFVAWFEDAVPTDEEGDPDASFVGGTFVAFHAGVEGQHGFAVFAGADFAFSGAGSRHSVVGEKDKNCVFKEVPFVELLHESAHIFIDVFDHAVETGVFSGEAEVGEAFGVFGWSDEGAVGSVGGDVGEEGVLCFLLFFDPTKGGGEKDIGAEAFGFYEGAVVEDGGVKVLVAGCIGAGAGIRLPDATSSVSEGFVEAALVRSIGLFVAQVPFAEDTAFVASFGEDLREDGGVEGHAFTFKNGMCNSIFEGMAASHESSAGWGAGRADKEAVEADAGVVEFVQIGGLYPVVSVSSNGSMSLIVGYDEDDVGFFTECWLDGLQRGDGRKKGQQED